MLHKGQRVTELTKKIGQHPRTGLVIDVRGDTVEIRWDDGHVSSLTGALLRPTDQTTSQPPPTKKPAAKPGRLNRSGAANRRS